MPYPVWRHLCRGREVGDDRAICPDCGAVGFFEGWALRMLEAMSQYQSTYGLKPIGPHRRLADRLFRHSRRSCHACAGSGLASLSERAWSTCRYCEGTGGFWDIPARKIEEIRAEILGIFPEAGAPTEILWVTQRSGSFTFGQPLHPRHESHPPYHRLSHVVLARAPLPTPGRRGDGR